MLEYLLASIGFALGTIAGLIVYKMELKTKYKKGFSEGWDCAEELWRK